MSIKKSHHSVLFLGKKNDYYCSEAIKFTQKNFKKVQVDLSRWGDKLPEDIGFWDGDYIFSYLSRHKVPSYLLKKAKISAINFHPGTPEYPGIGCNNFALYDNVKEYGVTCHYMSEVIDAGAIIDVKRFPVYQTDTVKSLLGRIYAFQLVLFYEIVGSILDNKPLPISKETWKRKAFTREEFDDLCEIKQDMSDIEVKKIIRATSYNNYQPYCKINNFKFSLIPDSGN